jgi:hypothetical protein
VLHGPDELHREVDVELLLARRTIRHAFRILVC